MMKEGNEKTWNSMQEIIETPSDSVKQSSETRWDSMNTGDETV